jgi:hypothetical protein
MKKPAGVVLLLLAANLAFAAEQTARAFADSISGLLFAADSSAIYDYYLPSQRAKVIQVQSDQGFTSSVRSIFGSVETMSYMRTDRGVLPLDDRFIAVETVWYRVTSSKHPEGFLLRLDITNQDGRNYLVKSELQGPAAPRTRWL